MNILSRVQKVNCCYVYFTIPINRNLSFYRDKIFESKSSDLKSRKQIIENLKNSYIYPYLISNFYQYVAAYTRKNNFRNFCVVNSETAKDIATKIIQDKADNDCVYYEDNPGLGLITHSLLTQTNSTVHAFERKGRQGLVLTQLKNKFLDKLNVRLKPKSTHTLPYEYIFEENPKKVIVVSRYAKFIRVLTLLSKMTGFSNTLPETTFYLTIRSDTFQGIQDYSNKHHINFETYCLFNLCFESKIMATYSTKDFIPFIKGNNVDICLIRVKQKEKLEIDLENSDYKYFCALLKILRRSKFQLVIPLLELAVPGSGLFLISKGLSMTTRVQDLKANEVLRLFELLKKDDGHKSLLIVSGLT